jgi:hypothetical protein
MTNPHPFQLLDDEGQFTIIADLQSDDLYQKYYPFFEEHEFEGNGYCWEGHITQILEKEDAALLEHVEFDPEAGMFVAIADSKEAQLRFVNVLSPIFADLTKLETFVTSADVSRIDD